MGALFIETRPSDPISITIAAGSVPLPGILA